MGGCFVDYFSVTSIVVLPGRAESVLAGPCRSTDGGKSWSASNEDRPFLVAADPTAPGAAYALSCCWSTNGWSVKPIRSTGMTGQSSGRGM